MLQLNLSGSLPRFISIEVPVVTEILLSKHGRKKSVTPPQFNLKKGYRRQMYLFLPAIL